MLVLNQPINPAPRQKLFIVVTVCCLMFVSGCQSTQTNEKATANPTPISEDSGIQKQLSLSDEVVFQNTRQLIDQHNFEKAKPLLVKLHNKYPSNHPILFHLALCQLHQDEFERALQTINKAIALAPSKSEFYNLRGNVNVKTAQYQSAEKDFLKSVELNANSSDALYNLALLNDIYFQDISTAYQYYRRYIALVPADKETQNWLKQLEYSLPKGASQ